MGGSPHHGKLFSALTLVALTIFGIPSVVAQTPAQPLTRGPTADERLKPALPPPDPEEERGKTPFDRQRDLERGDSYLPRGYRFGSFLFYPTVETYLERNDNIYAQPSNRVGDWIAAAGPSFRLRSDWNRHFFESEATFRAIRYFENGDDDQNNAYFSMRGQYDVSRALTVNGRVALESDHEDRGDPDAANGREPTPTRRYIARLEGEYRPSHVMARLSADLVRYDFSDVARANNTPINNDDRDRTRAVLTGRLGYEYLPETDAFIEVSVNRVDYAVDADDFGYRRSSTGQRFVVGTEVDFTGVTVGEVYLGWMRQDFEDERLETVSALDAGGRVRWNATNLTTVTMALTRTIDDVTNAGAAARQTTTGRIDVDHEFLRNLTANAYVSFSEADYQGIDIVDDTLMAGLRVEYLVNRHAKLGVRYDFRDRTSNSAGREFRQNVTRLDLAVRF